MANNDRITDYESGIEDDVSDDDLKSDIEKEVELETETSGDLINSKHSYKISYTSSLKHELAQSLQTPHQVSFRISNIKKRYTRRISLIEITGIIAESYNLLQRGRLPLVSNLSNDVLKENMLRIIVREIEEGTCPVVIEKNGEILSVKDFDQTGLQYHLNYIINIWKQQKRY
ncbi:RNA polymerase subunit RPO19 [Cetacean poxvirus 1]|nr:RNA polymerase subunit RPO19 [Cetacean poxvirus 1]